MCDDVTLLVSEKVTIKTDDVKAMNHMVLKLAGVYTDYHYLEVDLSALVTNFWSPITSGFAVRGGEF